MAQRLTVDILFNRFTVNPEDVDNVSTDRFCA